MRTGLAFIILTTTLAACTAQTAPAPTEIPSTLPPITTPTMQPSATTCPTAVPTVTPTPLSPDAQALKDIVFSDCIPVEESLPEGFEIPWNLLVKQIGSAYIVNPEDDTKIEIPYFSEKAPDGSYKFTYEFYVSPDGKWLAYQDISREKLIVEPTGTLLTNKDSDRIVWDKGNWFSIKRWVDNDTIFALYQPPEDTWFYPTVFLNPFTREEYVFLLQDMPNYLDNNFGGVLFTTHYLNSGELVPDPTMKRLVYPEWASDPEIFITNTLWDIENEKPLARLGFRHYTGNDPLWSQDGNNVLLLSSIQDQGEEWFDWFLVTADGDVRRITYFTEILKNEVYEVRNASRSWDGRFLVFNFSHKEPTETKIEIILDVQSDPLEGYCFPPPGEKPYSYSYSPLWSPDSKYLLISGEDDEEKEKHLLVDVENQVAYKIEQDMRVIGWIVKP